MNAPLPLKVTRDASFQAYDAVASASNEVAGRLAQRLSAETQGEVLFTPADRGRYATDASIYQVTPVGAFVPRHADEVKIAIDICRDLGVPIVPRGGGTSQCGQTVGAGLVIDHSKHVRSILSFDAEKRTAVVEPGIVLDHLNLGLKKAGLWYPVDVSTSAQATLGGMAGNNSCGSRSIAYGNMVHNVLGVQAWTADGALHEFGRFDQSSGFAREIGERVRQMAADLAPEIDQLWPKVLRRVAGYNLDIFRNQSERPYTADGSVNLAHLLVGSEGTLAVTKNLTLQLSELPKAKVLGIVNFPTFYKAMDSAQHIVKLGDGTLTAVELVDRTMIDLALQNPAFAPVVRTAVIGSPDAILLVEFSGASKEDLIPKLAQLEELMGDLGLPGSVVKMADDTPQKNLWEVRKAGLNIMMSLKGDGKPVSFIEDCAVPLEHLAEYTESLTEVFRRHGSKGTWYAHASVGTLHERPILDMRREGAARMRAIAEEASALVRKHKGAYSGEHGDGLCRGEWIGWQFGPKIDEAFRRIKQLFDPASLLCPQRIIDAPKMDDTRLMRFPPAYRVIPLAPALDWSPWNVQNDPATEQVTAPGTGADPAGGFAKAVEMCNNNGHCRKFDAGTMCPSYRVTRDEKHLTRGRANTLRLALSGQLGADGIASEEVREALDLCVSCKGCKRDCPTGVDMARMKTEFLYHWQNKHGLALKDKLVAHLPRWAPWAARLPWLANLRDTLPGAARLSELLFGFAARRSLPTWRSDTFMGAKALPSFAPEQADVVLFADTFNNYFESENAAAALQVLQAAGYRVHVARPAATDAQPGRPLCCGRTYLSGGLVDEARTEARRVIDALRPYVARGVPVVGLEPSCLLTLRDEFLVMGLGQDADALGAQAFLFEEFLAREHAAGKLNLPLKALPESRALLHGHCHQKAFDAVRPVQAVLGLIPGLKVELIESSCCGMAGSFGYDAEHYDVSMQMAELSLLPAV
ncbi:MAG: FAD-binding oxidoreductase, partial [Ramlibacter sp.]|nr:FAD-binding oxidoreductase [Ramlibacter sp.]